MLKHGLKQFLNYMCLICKKVHSVITCFRMFTECTSAHVYSCKLFCFSPSKLARDSKLYGDQLEKRMCGHVNKSNVLCNVNGANVLFRATVNSIFQVKFDGCV